MTASVSAQLIDSSGSTDRNYRAACRGRSPDQFISMIAVAAEQADESRGWLTALLARNYGDPAETQVLIKAADVTQDSQAGQEEKNGGRQRRRNSTVANHPDNRRIRQPPIR
jgi:four helix bundle protein